MPQGDSWRGNSASDDLLAGDGEGRPRSRRRPRPTTATPSATVKPGVAPLDDRLRGGHRGHEVLERAVGLGADLDDPHVVGPALGDEVEGLRHAVGGSTAGS